MAFNTAIFYDIENLLKGYSFSQQMAANLSLKEILTAIRQTQRIGDVALQRAYANWSDPRLGIMREDLNQLGIDPIQVFGFSRDQKKNAADIQLAIDAIDLAHVRPTLEVFVIVSGDGGFAALAKKLHEYGKTVIGCAYRSVANRTFQAVCDEFVPITDPEEDDRQDNGGSFMLRGAQPEVTEPRVARMTVKVKKLAVFNPGDAIAKTREVLRWFSTDCHYDLSHNGIVLSVIREALKYAVPDFQTSKLGFPKFVEYLQFACKGTPVCVVRPPHTDVCLRLRAGLGPGIEVLPDLEMREKHSLENYRSQLASGSPMMRLPDPDIVRAVAVWAASSSLSQSDIGSAIESASGALAENVPLDAVKLSILCFVSAEIFVNTAEGVPNSEQRLTLRSDMRSSEAILKRLYATARTKLEGALGEVHDEILQRLCPNGV